MATRVSPALHTPESLARTPNSLAPHYSRFRVTERVLLTGHSHQAWPDVARDAHLAAWDAAAERVDDKWDLAFEQADRVRDGFARLLGASRDEVALGQNTHELVVRFLSALPFASRPRLVRTDAEFHTLRRQLDRLAESRLVEVVTVSSAPVATLAARLGDRVDARTAAVMVSSVLFTTAEIVPELGLLASVCARHGAELLVDAYHQLNVVPCALAEEGLGDAFVVGGGYKYCQLGEGNAFLRVPPGRERYRPLLTGWFSEFARLTHAVAGDVPYGEGPARWAGSTYDPTSHYRAARVFAFFEEQGLTVELLRARSRDQIARLAAGFDALGLDPRVVDRDRSTPLERLGGFLALRAPRAEELVRRLRERGVWCDSRGDLLRLGPAPYVSDAELDAGIAALGGVRV
jgi:kynureninase